jgi:hypothetical protein
MRVEDRPEHHSHPGPSPEDEQEMSLAATLRHLVDDLFTHQNIAEKLQPLARGEGLEMLVENWKQGLAQQLYDATQTGIGGIVATLDLLQANPDAPVLGVEAHQWQQIEAWHKPFPVAYICREDLRGILAEEQIAALNDEEMSQIAAKMSDTYQDGGEYWNSLMEIANRLTTEGQTIPTLVVQPDEHPHPLPDPHDQ